MWNQPSLMTSDDHWIVRSIDAMFHYRITGGPVIFINVENHVVRAYTCQEYAGNDTRLLYIFFQQISGTASTDRTRYF